MRRIARHLLRRLPSVLLVAALLFWYFTRPVALPPGIADRIDAVAGDAARGERLFAMGGCAACHAAPGAEGKARLELSGGRRFTTPFGTFVAPNISPDPVAGIGAWRASDLVNAMKFGTSPTGTHYYPAFPWTSYTRVAIDDMADLFAYLKTLPPVPAAAPDHEVPFPFSWRRPIGLWKRLFVRDGWVVPDEALSEEGRRGRAIVEGLGHCGECHTPRGRLGQPLYDRWLAGAPNPTGRGRIPNITPAALKWSKADIVAYLRTGFTPDFDTVGGDMAEVVENLSKLPETDLAAIAAYLKEIPPIPDAPRAR